MSNRTLIDDKLKTERIHKYHHTGKGFKIAIWETENADHHEVVKACVQANAPGAEIKSFFWKGNKAQDIMRDIINWGADFCNMSFHGWNIDQYEQFKELDKYKERYDIACKFFDSVLCFAAIGNTGENEEVFPSATKTWDSHVIGVGSYLYRSIIDAYGIDGYVTINEKLDYLSTGSVWYKDTPYAGTSFATPTLCGMTACLGEQYVKIFGYKPKSYKIYYQMLDAISIKAEHEGKVYKVPVMELFKEHEIKFTLDSNIYTVDSREYTMDGKDGNTTVPSNMIAINKRTMVQTRYLGNAFKECLPLVEINDPDEWWNGKGLDIKVMSTR